MSISSRLTARIAAFAFAATLGVWAFLYFGADESPAATLLLFGPRWLVALPLIILTPLAGYARSYWAAGLTLLTGVVVAGPITGGRISTARLFESERPSLQQLRVVTWNMGGARPGPVFRKFLEQTRPTILFCQESGLTADEMPPGWKVIGQGGNRVASGLPIRFDGHLEIAPLGASGRLDRYVLVTPDGEVVLINLHLPTPRPGIEAALGSKFRDLSELRRIVEIRAEASRVARGWMGTSVPNIILAGDFNMPIESRIYRDNWSGFRNAFSEAGTGWGTTKQTSWFGIRIDHILYTTPWQCRKAWVGPAMGSDHRPLIADLAREDY